MSSKRSAQYSGAEVYDHVLEIREKHFLRSISFDSDGNAAFTGKEWYDKSEAFGINRERAKSQFIPYHDTETALVAEKSLLDDVGPELSKFYHLLSGKEWDFALVTTPEAAAKVDDLYLAKDYSGDAFVKEFVPKPWQLYRNEDGTFKYDQPIYTNAALPWFGNFEPEDYMNPHAPTVYNPVGYYRTKFVVPDGWSGREIFISFQSVESAYYLYVNGHKVGYSTDSCTAHDFNITRYLEVGENTVALKVFRWSIGSWLENQDFIRQSGIYRDVYLYSKDEAEIRDFFVKTKFDDRTSKDSDVTVTVETHVRALINKAPTTYQISAYIQGDDGTRVATAEDKSIVLEAAGDSASKLRDAGSLVTSVMKVTNPAKWFPDTPNLYSLVLELKKSDGCVIESVVKRIGFREIYKVNIGNEQEQLQITGSQLVVRGVNRHDIDLEVGHAVTLEHYIADLTLMKRHNLNAIRTSHYPNNRVLYALADELGLYVCAEANVESHRACEKGIRVPTGLRSGLSQWVAPVLDRNATNFETNKNSTSVIIWSLGNEATVTFVPLNDNYCFFVASMYLLARDPDRVRMYERESTIGCRVYEDCKESSMDPWSVELRKNEIFDIDSTMYLLPEQTQERGSVMPFIHCEYNHAMGQAYGNALEHWNVIRQEDWIQGGFIWDFIDQSIRTVRIREDGSREEFWGYGGDWIDTAQNDSDFCGNGIVFADRTPSPKMVEVKKVHQQVNFYMSDRSVTPGGDISLQVVNEYENTSLEAFLIAWVLTEDSIMTLDKGTLNLSTPSRHCQSICRGNHVQDVTISLKDFQPRDGHDYLLDISVSLKNDTKWAKAGYVVAYEQFQLIPTANTAPEMKISDKPFTSVNQVNDEIILTGTTDHSKEFKIVLDTRTGTITSYSVNGTVIMLQGPEQSLYRAQTYNDTSIQRTYNLRNLGSPESLSDLTVETKIDKTHVFMSMTGRMLVPAEAVIRYDVYGNGEILVQSQLICQESFNDQGLAKIGGRILISREFDNLTYYGRGPEENYVDRKTGSTVGVYKSKVYNPNSPMSEDSSWDGKKMLKPQENGNRCDVRWTALTNDDGLGLMITGHDLLEISVAHYTAEELNPDHYWRPKYRHPNMVPQRKEIVWNIDLHQHGVSDTAFCRHIPLEGYYFPGSGTYTYSYVISPIDTSESAQLMEESRAISRRRTDTPA